MSIYDPEKYRLFDQFLNQLYANDLYPETDHEFTRKIIEKQIQEFDEYFSLSGKSVLDVGCGQGAALEIFKRYGANPTGVTLGSDYEVCKRKGLDVIYADMSFIKLKQQYDVIWCRHALEHSVMPYFTIHELMRHCKSGGKIYVELPAPNTCSHHELNPNHYSCFTHEVWQALLRRSGLIIDRAHGLTFELPIGEDLYYYFFCSKQ